MMKPKKKVNNPSPIQNPHSLASKKSSFFFDVVLFSSLFKQRLHIL